MTRDENLDSVLMMLIAVDVKELKNEPINCKVSPHC